MYRKTVPRAHDGCQLHVDAVVGAEGDAVTPQKGYEKCFGLHAGEVEPHALVCASAERNVGEAMALRLVRRKAPRREAVGIVPEFGHRVGEARGDGDQRVGWNGMAGEAKRAQRPPRDDLNRCIKSQGFFERQIDQ